METKPLKLYNVIFPFWLILFWPSPPVILLTLLGNLAIDCLVVFLVLLALKHPARGSVLKRCWWKVWLLGFLSDIIGALWLAAGLFGAWALDADGTAGWVSDFAMAMTVNPFRHPLALAWTAAQGRGRRSRRRLPRHACCAPPISGGRPWLPHLRWPWRRSCRVSWSMREQGGIFSIMLSSKAIPTGTG